MYDVIIIGGSFAGLAAATQLGRARRKVLLLDTGLPRNRFAEASHGFLTRDGAVPADLLATARDQLARYPTVELRAAAAESVRGAADSFDVELAGGGRETGRRLVLAHGITDDLSGLPGLAECWGKTAIHCPYCHGYEFADRRTGLLLRLGDVLHLARLYRDWTDDLTIFANGAALDPVTRDVLSDMGVRMIEDTVLRLDHRDGRLERVITAAGPVTLDAIYIHPPFRFSTDIGVQLGCEVKQGGAGQFFVVDQGQQTTVPGVYAAGDIARPAHNISYAVADGVAAGAFAHQSLFAS